MKKQVSIKDVAREAGVSPTTVSYILNSTPGLSFTPETREKVMAAVEKLHYVANQAAKTLGSSRTEGIVQSKLIGIVIPQTENKELKQTLKQFRNACEQSQEEIYQLAREKSYYVPASKATQEEIDHVKSLFTQGTL